MGTRWMLWDDEFHPSIFTSDLVEEEEPISPCEHSYGRGQRRRVRVDMQVPRLPRCALVEILKFRAQNGRTGSKDENHVSETDTFSEVHVEDAEDICVIRESISAMVNQVNSMKKAVRAKKMVVPEKKGRGRARALSHCPHYLQPPGGLTQHHFSSLPGLTDGLSDVTTVDSKPEKAPTLTVCKSSRKKNAVTYRWGGGGRLGFGSKPDLRRTASEPQFLHTMSNDVDFPVLGSTPAGKARKAAIHTTTFTSECKSKLPTREERERFIASQYEPIVRKQPNLLDAELPPFSPSTVPFSDSTASQPLQVSEDAFEDVDVLETAPVNGDGLANGGASAGEGATVNEGASANEGADILEGADVNEGASASFSAIDLSSPPGMPGDKSVPTRRQNRVPKCVDRILKFYMNSAQASDKRITARQETQAQKFRHPDIASEITVLNVTANSSSADSQNLGDKEASDIRTLAESICDSVDMSPKNRNSAKQDSQTECYVHHENISVKNTELVPVEVPSSNLNESIHDNVDIALVSDRRISTKDGNINSLVSGAEGMDIASETVLSKLDEDARNISTSDTVIENVDELVTALEMESTKLEDENAIRISVIDSVNDNNVNDNTVCSATGSERRNSAKMESQTEISVDQNNVSSPMLLNDSTSISMLEETVTNIDASGTTSENTIWEGSSDDSQDNLSENTNEVREIVTGRLVDVSVNDIRKSTCGNRGTANSSQTTDAAQAYSGRISPMRQSPVDWCFHRGDSGRNTPTGSVTGASPHSPRSPVDEMIANFGHVTELDESIFHSIALIQDLQNTKSCDVFQPNQTVVQKDQELNMLQVKHTEGGVPQVDQHVEHSLVVIQVETEPAVHCGDDIVISSIDTALIQCSHGRSLERADDEELVITEKTDSACLIAMDVSNECSADSMIESRDSDCSNTTQGQSSDADEATQNGFSKATLTDLTEESDYYSAADTTPNKSSAPVATFGECMEVRGTTPAGISITTETEENESLEATEAVQSESLSSHSVKVERFEVTQVSEAKTIECLPATDSERRASLIAKEARHRECLATDVVEVECPVAPQTEQTEWLPPSKSPTVQVELGVREIDSEAEEITGTCLKIPECNLFKNYPSSLENDSEYEDDSQSSCGSLEKLLDTGDLLRYIQDVENSDFTCTSETSDSAEPGQEGEISDTVEELLYDRNWTRDFRTQNAVQIVIKPDASADISESTVPELVEPCMELSTSESISTSTSSLSSYSTAEDQNSRDVNKDGFQLCLNWKVRGTNVIQVEGLPLKADVSVLDQFVECYGKVLNKEIKWANDQKFVRYKLATADACVMAVGCLHDADCLYPEHDKPAVLICYMP